MDETVHGVVLAAGRSTRMGRDKAELLYAGKPAIRRAEFLFAGLGFHFALSLRNEQRFLAEGRQVIVDRWPDVGPLGGIATALETFADDAILVVPIDLPNLRVHHLQALMSPPDDADACCFHSDGKAVPLPSLWRPSCREHLLQSMENREFALDQVFARLNVHQVNIDPDALTNVDDPADYERVTGGALS